MEESNLVQHARFELQRAGLFDADADYGGAIGHAVMEVVEVYAKQEHSGGSAAVSFALLEKLLQFKPLTPITSDPEEWMDVSDISGIPMWQNRRDSTCFSYDGGKTWYDLDSLPREQEL